MKICETGCSAMCAATRCTNAGLEGLNAEAAQLAATIKKKYEALGI